MTHIHPNFEESFRVKFPYPMAQYPYSAEEYRRINRISERWYALHYILGLVFWLAFSVALMYVLHSITALFYSSLNTKNTQWFPLDEYSFIIPAFFVSLPLGGIAAINCIRIFHAYDYKHITDLLNTRLQYDAIRGWRWALKPLALCCLFVWLIVSWAYVAVSDNGVEMKKALTFGPTHYDYHDMELVRPMRHGYDLYFKDGKNFNRIAPFVDRNRCIMLIASKTNLPIVNIEK